MKLKTSLSRNFVNNLQTFRGFVKCILRFCFKFSMNIIFYRGRSRFFFRRGCTRLLLYFNTNKPQCFFFGGGRVPVVLENRRSSQGGGVRTPGTLPLDPPLFYLTSEHREAKFLAFLVFGVRLLHLSHKFRLPEMSLNDTLSWLWKQNRE